MKVHFGPYRKNRKISVRIDKYDTWNMDHTLALIIHPMLIQLKETKHGSQLVDDEDVPENLRSTMDPDKTVNGDKFEHDRWDWVLDEMIYAFDAAKNDEHEDQFWSNSDVEEDYQFTDNEFIPYDQKFNKEAWEADWKRRQNGLRLFGKYYHGLWD